MIWQPCPICDFPFEENDPAFLAHIDSHYSSELAAVTDKCAPLTSFHTSSAQDDTVETDDPFRTCPYCGNFLAGNSFQEHVDLHAAEEEAANYEAKTREDEQLARTLQAEQEDMTRQDADLARVLQGAQGDTVCRQDEELARALEAEDLQATTHTSQSTSTGMKRRGSDSVINESAINAKRQSVSHTSHTFTIPRFMPDNGSTRTDGIIPLLRSLLVTTAQGSPRSKKENHTRRAWLCREGVVHYRAGPQDSGWGCGYRNFQMLLSALSRIREYNATLSRMLYAGLNHGEGRAHVPDVSTIQEMIEAGWTAGFDAVGITKDLSGSAGARQLGHKLTGTKKWIGTTEVASCLRYYYVRAKVYDFHRPTGPAGAHPKLVDFVEEYFCGRVGAANGGEGLGESVKGKEAGKVWDWKSRRAEEMRLVVSDKPP
ncbi:hypothetical protein HK097_008230 [Rhizophlyctis rosea]|uniref:UFSP1/2/DUB catalytic domain-containing protein n=1 Tax=Rhizophlyctis rosea TaxID=64517 RepID=A0AAD5SCM9_9FUNG|nr:hypothetical protein HK097_008230 [Rhizophlyctis rosea]